MYSGDLCSHADFWANFVTDVRVQNFRVTSRPFSPTFLQTWYQKMRKTSESSKSHEKACREAVADVRAGGGSNLPPTPPVKIGLTQECYKNEI